jgi:meiotically up-regulated gene 157 (Mug157) protein
MEKRDGCSAHRGGLPGLKIAPALLLTFALSASAPATAQTLNIPLESRIRPIDTQTLFHEFFADFFHESDGTTYVQTGDIPAMWLRDSAAQTMPYIRFVRTYPRLHATFFGVIQRDAKNILSDPYAEAFRADYHVWEDKWEIDSLAWPVLLVFVYYANTRDRRIFTPTLHTALRKIVATLQCEQHHATCSHYSWPQPVWSHARYNPRTGMIWDAFRPSDDPVVYHYNIPQNAIAVVAMRLVTAFARDAFRDAQLAQNATALASQVQGGIERYGRVYNRRRGGWLYAYETDGYGHAKMMDDANIPNLTALPYIGWCATNDPIYLNTRRFTLSSDDPYYYIGKYATGLGSEHTPRGWVWPLGIIGAALTATTRATITDAVEMLDQSDTLNGLMHESIDPNDPQKFTRPEFGWANAFWADLLFRTVAGYPATPLGLLSTMVPNERQSEIPTITPVWTQATDRFKLVYALGRLLAGNRDP